MLFKARTFHVLFKEEKMSPVHCAICQLRISDWMMSSGKTEFVGKDLVHKSCLQDKILKWGQKNNDNESDGA